MINFDVVVNFIEIFRAMLLVVFCLLAIPDNKKFLLKQIDMDITRFYEKNLKGICTYKDLCLTNADDMNKFTLIIKNDERSLYGASEDDISYVRFLVNWKCNYKNITNYLLKGVMVTVFLQLSIYMGLILKHIINI